MIAADVLDDLATERRAQHAIFGEQNLSNGTGSQFKAMADAYRKECDDAFDRGEGTWRHVLLEEVAEALAESDPVRLRAELVQAIAVGTAWVECIDRHALENGY
jgi:hypothetical protein